AHSLFFLIFSGNEDDGLLADDSENVKQYETLLEAFEDKAFQRYRKAEAYESQHMSEMHRRDLLREREDEGIHLEKILEGLHGILLHPEDAIGDSQSGYGECEEIVSQTSNFQQHEASQTEKPHKCPKCNKGFRWCFDLIKHQRTPTGEKLFTCSECRENFRVSSHLISHRKMHTGERPYPCLKCRKSFRQNSHLRNHQRAHTGERPFKCMYCGKGFSDFSAFAQHQQTHTGEEPTACCGKFHTGEKPFMCAECGKSMAAPIILVSLDIRDEISLA
uniref:C2H2-type domain-containing protein n=1 Tax=Otus sunia TaxID=257818 RepID=A0A8C8AZB6_9STRI